MFGKRIQLKLQGSNENMEHVNLGIYYRPCIPKPLGSEGLCTADINNKTAMNEFLEKQKAYVGEAKFEFLHNQ